MNNIILTITGPSLSGKTTLESRLVGHYKMERIVSFTTRPIRKGEINGEHYYFLDRSIAEKKIADGHMAEHVEFQGHLYGILGSELQYKLQKNSCIAVVEPRGVKQLSEYCKENGLEHKAVFLTNHPNVLAARFLQRFKEDDKASPLTYSTRLVNMIRDEQNWIHEFDYDLIFTHFDSSNEDYLVQKVYKDMVESSLPKSMRP